MNELFDILLKRFKNNAAMTLMLKCLMVLLYVSLHTWFNVKELSLSALTPFNAAILSAVLDWKWRDAIPSSKLTDHHCQSESFRTRYDFNVGGNRVSRNRFSLESLDKNAFTTIQMFPSVELSPTVFGILLFL